MLRGGKVTLVVEEKAGRIVIKIGDNGVGIPPENMDDLFRPFQSSKDTGLGLGLVFCKNAVEAHGGNILVESEVGKGTTFTIIIPSYIVDNGEYIVAYIDALIYWD